MAHKRLRQDWSIRAEAEDFEPALKRFRGYMMNNGFRESKINGYLACLKRFLTYAHDDQPSLDTARSYRELMIRRNLASSSVNNISFSIKYLAMLKTLFYGCLRASELCNLDMPDLDMKTQTIRIRDGKGGKDGVVFLKDECIKVLRQYLAMRPQLEENDQSLFYTVYGKRWDRRDVHRIFVQYKNKAGISKPGGVHCFARHTPATIMIAKGADVKDSSKNIKT
jgi:site-specific recombinase XerD